MVPSHSEIPRRNMSDRSDYHYGPSQAGPSSASKSPTMSGSLSSSHPQASAKYSPSHGPVRLPRLQFMDQDVPRRNRSVSSASQTGYGGGFGPWSPSSPDRHSAISGGGSSSHGGDAGAGIHSPPQAQRSFSHHHHPQGSRSPIFPNLPTPSRRSTMMDGSLPPLSILHGEREREGPWQNSGRMSAGPGPSGARHHHAPYQQVAAPSKLSAYPPFASGQYPDGLPPPPPPPPHAPLPTEARGLATPAPTSTPASGSLAAASSGPNEAVVASASERKTAKAHVSSACLNCKRAHLACDAERPCRRCTKLGKTATCVDVQHKKRGRPRLKDRESMSMSELSPSSATYGPAGGAPWQPHHEGAHGYPPPVMPAVAHGPASASNLNATARGRSFSATSAVTSSSSSGTTSRYPLASPASVATSLDSGPGPIVTMLCGTDIVAAQISSEAQIIFGLHPSQLHHRSVLELVHPDDVPRFETCWSKLVEPVGIEPSAFPSIGRDIMRNHHCPLLAPARGTIFIEEAVRMRTAGNKPWSTCSIRTHLGGAFGLDLYRPETKDRAYVVCSIAVGPEGNQHPDMTALRSKEFPPGPWPNVAFSTPMPETPQRSLLPGRPRAPTVGEVPSYGRPSGRDWGARYHEHAMPPGPPRDGEHFGERAGRKRSFGEVEGDDPQQRGEEQLQQRRGSGASALFVAEKMHKSTSPTQDARPVMHRPTNGAHESAKAQDESVSPPATRESKDTESKPLTPPDHIRHPFSSYPHTASGARFQPYSIPRAANGSMAKGNGTSNGSNSSGDHFRWPSASSTSSSSSLSSSSMPSSTPRFLSSTARSTMMEAPSSSSSSSHNMKRPITSSVVDNNPLRRSSAGPPKPASPVAAAGRTSVSSARGGRVSAGELGFVAC